MENVNWGILGCGDVCERKSGPPMYKTPHSALAAVMRRDAAKAADFARRHGVPRSYTDADALIADPGVDIVYVATPPDSHRELALKVLAAGKPVYVEKPMAMNHAECLDMIAAAERSGQRLFVAYYRRALPYFLKVKELLDSGAVGEVLSVDLAAGATLGMDVATTDLYMKVAGNSAADITGTTKYYTLFATSKAKVDSRTLEAMDVRVEAASGAEAYVCATERLQMISDTGAAIFYRGAPSIVRSSAKMMGTINSIGQ